MIVEKSKNFNLEYIGLMLADRKKVAEFIMHVEQHGLTGLPGRNKKSDNVSPNYHGYERVVKYAQEHKLWHYHAGFPEYQRSKAGDFTSEGIIHYQRFPDRIRLISITNHRGNFSLPKQKAFENIFFMTSLKTKNRPY